MSLTSVRELAAGSPGARMRRWPALNYEGAAMVIAVALAWQVASRMFPPFLFQPFGEIFAAIREIFVTPALLGSIGATFARILIALAASFAAALVLGICSGFRAGVDRALMPLVQLMQGVPAVCWVVFAVLWFKNLETRIAFVVVVGAFPSFYYQIREGVRSVPPELGDMVRALRPGTAQLIRKLVLPWLAPQILTAWRLNLGSGTKITIMAELLGGISGIGYQLRLAQDLFRMDRAIAWTVVLVLFVLLSNAVVGLF